MVVGNVEVGFGNSLDAEVPKQGLIVGNIKTAGEIRPSEAELVSQGWSEGQIIGTGYALAANLRGGGKTAIGRQGKRAGFVTVAITAAVSYRKTALVVNVVVALQIVSVDVVRFAG